MKGINIAEGCHVINALPPVSTNAGKTSAYWSMKNYSHASIILTYGAAVAVNQVLVYESATAIGGGEHAITFKYYSETTAAGDVLDYVGVATAAGFATASAGTASTMHVIEVDASELSEDHPFMCVKLTVAAADQLGSIVVILSGARYGQEASVTALA
jgi:hypothetical protein